MKTFKIIGGGFAAALLTYVAFGCTSVITPSITPVPPVIVDQDKCQLACDNLKLLNCDEGKDIQMKTKCLIDAECAAGQTCSQASGFCVTPCAVFCRDTEEQGVWLDPNCVAHITACDQIENCPVPSPPVMGSTGSNKSHHVARSCSSTSCQINL